MCVIVQAQERARAAARKDILPASHARVRLDREPTQPLEDPMATPTPDLVSDEVAHHRARERKRRREPQAEVAGPG